MSIDARTFRIVAGGLVLALLLILALVGTVAIVGAVVGHEVSYPSVLDNILTGLVTGLFGLLVNARGEEPVDVNVTNPTADPVPTADVPARGKRRERGESLVVALVVVLLAAIVVSVIIR